MVSVLGTRLPLLALMVAIGTSVNATYIPVYTMLPLDTITSSGLSDQTVLKAQLASLKSVGTDGITVDVWWGLVETTEKTYNWNDYSTLFSLITAAGLKIQPILDFHKCGGNVGDTCNIELPSWVLSVGTSNPDIFYKDSDGNYDNEYLSLWVDDLQLFGGRSATEIYKDFFQSFWNEFGYLAPNSMSQVEIGMGPAGELRYPSYQLAHWTFCGVGEFQSYNKYALADVATAAQAAGHSDWGLAGGPSNAGNYNSYVSSAPFFQDNQPNNYASDYGRFYLAWYSQNLLSHADKILSAASSVFGSSVTIAGKVAGIHWWYLNPSHAAEITAGYYNTNGNNAYASIAQTFAKYKAAFYFTCLEMLDSSQPPDCDCGPQQLVSQTKAAAIAANIPYGGENALPFYNSGPYSQIETAASELGAGLASFSYLRLTPQLVQQPNLGNFQSFVSSMHSLNVGTFVSSGSSHDNGSTAHGSTDDTKPPGITAVAVLGIVACAFAIATVAVVALYKYHQRRAMCRAPPSYQLTQSLLTGPTGGVDYEET